MTRLIDADALKKAITDATYNFEQIPIRVDKVQEIIDNAPTVDTTFKEVVAYECGQKSVERPKGEWARHDEWVGGVYVGGFYHVNCLCEDGYYSKWETNYCPNCGADMRKEVEE